jgi:hypothetical protein
MAISSKLGGACVYTLTSVARIGALGAPVSICDEVAQAACIVTNTSAIANRWSMDAILHPNASPKVALCDLGLRYLGGVAGGAVDPDGAAAGAADMSAVVLRFVNRHPSFVFTRLSV